MDDKKLEKQVDFLFTNCPDLFEVWEQYAKLYKAYIELEDEHKDLAARCQACSSQLEKYRAESQANASKGDMAHEY
jgi:hypothetical protein